MRSASISPLTAFRRIRECTEALAAPLSPEDQTAQSMPDVSPTKWHRAHTTWFFETFVLERFEPDFAPFDASYRELFNSYYEAVGPRFPRPERGVITRPGAAEVGEYRRAVDARVEALLEESDDPSLRALVTLGLHHEQQHQELLLMDAKHVLSCNPLAPVYRPPRPRTGSASESSRLAGDPTPAGRIAVSGGVVEIGVTDPADDEFAYDNESPRHRVHLEPFELDDRLVTAGEWIEFIADGGYRRPELWLSDGWASVQEHGWHAPLYWRCDDPTDPASHVVDDWRVFTLGGERPAAADEPVCHVSFYEADAYARWAGARLPTEFEWEHAVAATGSWHPCPLDLDHLHPRPATPSGDGERLRQLTGAAWQWTASAYLPYPGFAAGPGAIGEYNGKFMSGQMVLRGGSALTPTGHPRPTYRNFFPPAARWPMTGVRLAHGGHPR